MSNDSFAPEIDEEQLQLISHAYALRELYLSAYTWTIQTNYLKFIEQKKQELTSRSIDSEALKLHLPDLFDKINASFYHLQKVKESEQLITDLGKEVAKKSQVNTPTGTLGIFGATYEPIGYEYEALLVTLRSALDLLAIILASILGSKSDDIMKLTNELDLTKQSEGLRSELKSFFDTDTRRKLVSEFRNSNGTKSRRNHAVHAGSLSTGTINIQFVADRPDMGVLKAKAMPVSGDLGKMTTEQDLDDFCSTLFYDTCELLMDALEIILAEKLARGKKMSVYEAKRSRVSSK
jgi:hypothetical protein